MKILIEEEQLYIYPKQAITSDELFAYFHIAKNVRNTYYQEKRILVNGECITKNTMIEKDGWISITLLQESDDVVGSNEQALDVIYEDDVFLLVNKPIGYIIHSDGNAHTKTLDSLVKHYYHQHNILAPTRAIHRLDKDTTGLVIYCKIPFFQPLLDKQLENKEISRVYLALIKGNLNQKEVWIQKPLGKDRHDAKKMRVSPKGMYAATKVIRKKVLKDTTLIECHLKTGRTHQIRVHLASIGYPLLSDALYGSHDTRIARCALHAWMVKLIHPMTHEVLEIKCEMPNDMLQIIKQKQS